MGRRRYPWVCPPLHEGGQRQGCRDAGCVADRHCSASRQLAGRGQKRGRMLSAMKRTGARRAVTVATGVFADDHDERAPNRIGAASVMRRAGGQPARPLTVPRHAVDGRQSVFCRCTRFADPNAQKARILSEERVVAPSPGARDTACPRVAAKRGRVHPGSSLPQILRTNKSLCCTIGLFRQQHSATHNITPDGAEICGQ
jgi:hypothetical protein